MAKNTESGKQKFNSNSLEQSPCLPSIAANSVLLSGGLIFLKYISDSFETLHTKLVEGQGKYKGADPEDKDECNAENVFFVPPYARWSYLHARSKQSSIGKDVDDAMLVIEKANPSLKGILPKVFA